MAGGGYYTAYFFNQMFPIVAVYPPTRWQRLKAWLIGTQAESMVIRRVW